MTEERGKSMSGIKDGRESSGFSLVEVMVAMVMTMIVAGSIYGLLTGGQKAFRREPEKTELQQNLRSAMDFIMRDVANAGGGPGCDSKENVCDGITQNIQPVLQVFTLGLDGQGPARPGGGNSDVLQLLYADPSCRPVPIDLTSNPAAVNGTQKLPACFTESRTAIVFAYTSDHSRTYWGLADPLVPGTKVKFTSTQPVGANTAFPGGSNQASVSVGKLVRYEVCTAVGDTMPSLCRSERGGYDSGGNFVAAPDPAGGWQVVARGIEDLQVTYRNGRVAPPATWQDAPDAVNLADWTTLTKEVRVTLSGRGALSRIEGQSGPAGVVPVLRAQLESTGTPRAVLHWLRALSAPASTLWSSLVQGPGAWS
jgi:Tfp pilus assembly protein PilW